jgi:hypothetical protein
MEPWNICFRRVFLIMRYLLYLPSLDRIRRPASTVMSTRWRIPDHNLLLDLQMLCLLSFYLHIVSKLVLVVIVLL